MASGFYRYKLHFSAEVPNQISYMRGVWLYSPLFIKKDKNMWPIRLYANKKMLVFHLLQPQITKKSLTKYYRTKPMCFTGTFLMTYQVACYRSPMLGLCL